MAEIWANLLAGFSEIFSAPFRDPSIFWLLVPIILFWFVLEVYLGRYKAERLGWSTSLSYGLNMFWVVIISLRTLFEKNFELFSIDKLLFIIFIALYSIFIIFISFTHRMQGKIFFLFTSPTLVYYLFGIDLLWINELLNVSLWVIIDLVILYMFIVIVETILKKMIPTASETGTNELEADSGLGFGKENTFNNMGRGMGRF